MSNEKGNDFIHFLTAETFDLADQKCRQDRLAHEVLFASTESGQNLDNELAALGITHWSGEYCSIQQVFRFLINGQIIDFPRNWSVFPVLHQALELQHDDYIKLDRQSDGDQLLEILFGLYQAERFFFATYQGHVLLIADRFLSSAVVEILQRYCCPPLPFNSAA